MMNQLDRQLAAYCSPTLAGITPASLVSFDRALYPDLPQRLKTYREAFAPRGVHQNPIGAVGDQGVGHHRIRGDLSGGLNQGKRGIVRQLPLRIPPESRIGIRDRVLAGRDGQLAVGRTGEAVVPLIDGGGWRHKSRVLLVNGDARLRQHRIPVVFT